MADNRGKPVAFTLTPGNIADICMAIVLLGAVVTPKRLLADKAYDADSLRKWLKQRKVKAVIPSQNYVSGLALAAIISAWIE